MSLPTPEIITSCPFHYHGGLIGSNYVSRCFPLGHPPHGSPCYMLFDLLRWSIRMQKHLFYQVLGLSWALFILLLLLLSFVTFAMFCCCYSMFIIDLNIFDCESPQAFPYGKERQDIHFYINKNNKILSGLCVQFPVQQWGPHILNPVLAVATGSKNPHESIFFSNRAIFTKYFAIMFCKMLNRYAYTLL